MTEKVKASFTEISNAAAETVSKALSKLVDKPVSLEFSKIGVKKVDDLCPLIPSEEIVSGVFMPVTGDAEGAALLVLTKDNAFTLADLLNKREPGTTRQLTELDESALKEVGNIITGAYLTVISDTAEVKLIERIPSLASDMFGAIISQAVSKFAEEAEEVFVVEVEFMFQPLVFKGYFLLFFGLEDSKTILSPLA